MGKNAMSNFNKKPTIVILGTEQPQTPQSGGRPSRVPGLSPTVNRSSNDNAALGNAMSVDNTDSQEPRGYVPQKA